MVWSIDTDDFHGDCERERLKIQDTNSKKYSFPLLKAVNEAIKQSHSEGEGDLSNIDDIPEVDTNDIDDRKDITKKPTSSSFALCPFPIHLTVIILFVNTVTKILL